MKIEIDTDPPEGAGIETTRLNRFVPLHLQHHDRPSLLAGKIAAVLTRPWTRGRNLFDLFWYLGDRDWPAPNITMLGNALRQAGEEVVPEGTLDWRARVRAKIATLAWAEVRRDVDPFLREGSAGELFTREHLLDLIQRG